VLLIAYLGYADNSEEMIQRRKDWGWTSDWWTVILTRPVLGPCITHWFVGQSDPVISTLGE
jgi:hypothetical protein